MATTTEKMYREANRRSHRLLGCYLALSAWELKVDCVVLARKELLAFLGLKRMQNKRIDWLTSDIKGVFPHAKPLYRTKDRSYATLYLSRFPFPGGFPWGSLSIAKRVARLNKNGLKTAAVSVPTEADLVSALARITHGLEGLPLAL